MGRNRKRAGVGEVFKPTPMVRQDGGAYGRGIDWNPKARKPVVKVDTLEDAYREILKGNYVEMPNNGEVYTMVKKLKDWVEEQTKAGNSVSNIDICRVSVPGTNLFCGESVATSEFPEGIPRKKMPQLSGRPLPGSKAESMPRRLDPNGNPTNEVDAGPAFADYLASKGIDVTDAVVPAASLKASQSQLKGTTVSGFFNETGLKVLDDPNQYIYVSRDGYIIDGHHRWAAQVARDLEDGKPGDLPMRVRIVNMPILEVLDAANKFATEVGIDTESA